jgi:hypothetical protein
MSLGFRRVAQLRLVTVEYSGIFTLSGETHLRRGLDKTGAYLWKFALMGSRTFSKISSAVVGLYFPNELLAVAGYSPPTSDKTKLVDLGADLKATVGVASIGFSAKWPITRAPPVRAAEFVTEDDCGVRWDFSGLEPDSRFSTTVSGAITVAAYDSAKGRVFNVAAHAEAAFGRGTVRKRWEPLRLAGVSGEITVA